MELSLFPIKMSMSDELGLRDVWDDISAWSLAVSSSVTP